MRCDSRYLETVGLSSLTQEINDIREGWRHPNLRVSGHNHLLAAIKAHPLQCTALLEYDDHVCAQSRLQ